MKELKIKYAKLIPNQTVEEYAQLEKNIVANGCLDPIKINKDDVILDGHTRHKICKQNNIEFKTKVLDIGDETDEKIWIYTNQIGRRNLNIEQLRIVSGEHYNLVKQQVGGQKTGGDNLPTRSSVGLAKKYSVSESTIRKNAAFVDLLDDISVIEPSFKDKIKNAELKATKNEIVELTRNVKKDKVQAKKIIDKAIKENKSLTASRREVLNESYSDKTLKPTDKKYSVIYADPPWTYGAIHGTENYDYKPMTNIEIYNMPVKELCDKDCVLFLWCTSPMLPEGIKTIESWGFSYKTSIVWDKIKHNVGNYVSVRHEFLLIAGKGQSTPTMDKKKLYDSVISIERSKIHSEKPEEFRKLIEELYPHTQKIELFARKETKGWDNYGNERL